jgi:hypothetical protein
MASAIETSLTGSVEEVILCPIGVQPAAPRARENRGNERA